MIAERGSSKAIAEIVKLGRRISVEEMGDIAKFAESAGGKLVSVSSYDDDDDWCGNGTIHFPWPRPPKEWGNMIRMLDSFAEKRINYEVLINGIPVPDHIAMDVFRGIRRGY